MLLALLKVRVPAPGALLRRQQPKKVRTMLPLARMDFSSKMQPLMRLQQVMRKPRTLVSLAVALAGMAWSQALLGANPNQPPPTLDLILALSQLPQRRSTITLQSSSESSTLSSNSKHPRQLLKSALSILLRSWTSTPTLPKSTSRSFCHAPRIFARRLWR